MILNRKRVTKEQKFTILKEHFELGTPLPSLARVHKIHPATLYKWKHEMDEKPEKQIKLEELLIELEKVKKENRQLTHALGELTLDNQCLKDLTEFLKKKQNNAQLNSQKNSSKKKR